MLRFARLSEYKVEGMEGKKEVECSATISISTAATVSSSTVMFLTPLGREGLMDERRRRMDEPFWVATEVKVWLVAADISNEWEKVWVRAARQKRNSECNTEGSVFDVECFKWYLCVDLGEYSV